MKEIAFKYIGYLLLCTVAWVVVVNLIPGYQTWWMLVIALPIAFWWYLVLSGLTKKRVGLYPSLENEIEEIEQELKAGKVTEEEARKRQALLKGEIKERVEKIDEIIMEDFKDSEKILEIIKRRTEDRGK